MTQREQMMLTAMKAAFKTLVSGEPTVESLRFAVVSATATLEVAINMMEIPDESESGGQR